MCPKSVYSCRKWPVSTPIFSVFIMDKNRFNILVPSLQRNYKETNSRNISKIFHENKDSDLRRTGKTIYFREKNKDSIIEILMAKPGNQDIHRNTRSRLLIKCFFRKLFLSFLSKVTSATKQFPKMCHQWHWLRIFLFRKKVMFCSRNIQVFIFLTIP